MRVYVPAGVDDLGTLEHEGRLPSVGRVVLAVTPWALTELGLDDPEDELAEHAVLDAAAEESARGAVAVLVFELAGEPPGGDLAEGVRVRLEGDLPRRRLVAVHLLPGLDWYAGHELPQVIALLT